jgi:diacylglycerol kinase (ATP)
VRIAVAANTASGGGFDPAPLLAALPDAQLFDFDALADIAAAAPDRLVVAGGDGSVGPLAALAGELGVPLAVIPAGTANDFARVHGLPTNLPAAAELARSSSAGWPTTGRS